MKATEFISRIHTASAIFVGMVLFACSAAYADENNNNDLPEFQLPSYDVESFWFDITPPAVKTLEVPRLRSNMNGVKVTMTFNIGKDGKIAKIRDNASYYDERANYVATVMARTLKTWHFEPALDKNGDPIAIKVALPVQIVKRKGNAQQYASMNLQKPVILAVLDR